jgi:hypothetical protein
LQFFIILVTLTTYELITQSGVDGNNFSMVIFLRKEPRYIMEATLPGRNILNRLIGFVDQFVEKRQQMMPPQTIDALDALHEEICRMEQALADVATRPSRVVRKSCSVEPLTEQQKIIDLAG